MAPPSGSSSSVRSSQSSSTLLQRSALGAPAATLQAVLLPAQMTLPVRMQAPAPTEHDAPVGRHLPPQSEVPPGHVPRQTPEAQVSPAAQTFAQKPHAIVSERKSRSQPSAASALQSAKEAAHSQAQVELPSHMLVMWRAGGGERHAVASSQHGWSWLPHVSHSPAPVQATPVARHGQSALQFRQCSDSTHRPSPHVISTRQIGLDGSVKSQALPASQPFGKQHD